MDTEGELARWFDEDKIKLAKAMLEADLIPREDARAQAVLDETLPLAQRGEAAGALIAERYGDDYFDSYTVEETEFPEAKRTRDERAAYSQWSDAYWSEWSARDKQPLTQSRVYLATMYNLTEIGDFPRTLIREVQVDHVWDEQERLYLVTASVNKDAYLAAKRDNDQISLFDPSCGGFVDGDSLCFQFWLDSYGVYKGIYDASAPENRAELTLEEGQAIAEKALRVRLSVDQTALNGMLLRSSYGEGNEYILAEGRFNAVCTYMWNEPDGEGRYYVEIDAKTGRVIQAFDWRESNAMRDKERAWIAEIQALLDDAGVSGTLFNDRGQYFWHWSLEEKAAWSQIARPIVQTYLAEHADFAQYLEDLLANRFSQSEWPNLISLSQYAYGVPDSAAISREQAFAVARDAAIAAGAKQRYVDDNLNHSMYYDVTDPEKPLWKVKISVLFGADDTEHLYDATAPWAYFAVIDAHTGALMHLTLCTVNTDIRDTV